MSAPAGHTTPPALTRYAWASIAAAVLTIVLKFLAYRVTGSVGLLSDAAESLVNLAAALVALWMLGLAARPADTGHPFGHGKAEYFASGLEGALILVAAGGIAWAAWERWEHPQALAELDIGMALSASAALVNLATGLLLLRAGRQYGSITLEADGKHLLTDVWTTLAILLALGGILLTGWEWLDPAIAAGAALQIVWTGVGLMARSASGLLDAALPAAETARIEAILDRYRAEGIQFHDLRTRVSGMQRFMTVHVLVPGTHTVQAGHDLLERIEADIRAELDHISIVTHLEPLEDAASFAHERIEDPPETDGKGKPQAGRRAQPARRKPRKIQRGWGLALLVLGSAASMLLPENYAAIALGVSLFGLVLELGLGRFQGDQP